METRVILENIFMFLLFFLIIFVIIYFVNLSKYKSKKKKEIMEIAHLIRRFKLNPKLLHIRQMILWISIIDAFIISFVGTFVFMLPVKYVWKFLIGFVLLFALIYALFEIYGRHLVNKERNDK